MKKINSFILTELLIAIGILCIFSAAFIHLPTRFFQKTILELKEIELQRVATSLLSEIQYDILPMLYFDEVMLTKTNALIKPFKKISITIPSVKKIEYETSFLLYKTKAKPRKDPTCALIHCELFVTDANGNMATFETDFHILQKKSLGSSSLASHFSSKEKEYI